MSDIEKVLGLLEKHQVELPQALLDELSAAGLFNKVYGIVKKDWKYGESD